MDSHVHAPHIESHNLRDFDVTKPSAIFFGTEKDGLSEEVLNQADSYIKIPMVGFTESLNISVSAAIILQHITNELKQSEVDWKLTDEEFFDTQLLWTKNTIKSSDKIIERYYEKEGIKKADL